MDPKTFAYKVTSHSMAVVDVESSGVRTRGDFKSLLEATMNSLDRSKVKGVVLKLSEDRAEMIPEAVAMGFSFHLLQGSSLQLLKKLRPCNVPSGASHAVGAGAVVLSPDGGVLMVKEARGPARGVWKLPTGRLEPGESLQAGIEREVQEETGVKGKFLGLLSVRDAFPTLYGLNELFLVGVLRSEAKDLRPCPDELEDAKWFSVEEFRALGYKHDTFRITLRMLERLQSQGEASVSMAPRPAREFFPEGGKKFYQEFWPSFMHDKV